MHKRIHWFRVVSLKAVARLDVMAVFSRVVLSLSLCQLGRDCLFSSIRSDSALSHASAVLKSMALCCISVSDCRRRPKFRLLRATSFVGMACMGLFPMIHMVFHNGLENKVGRVLG